MSYGVKTANSFFALLDNSQGDGDVSNKKKNKKKKNKSASGASADVSAESDQLPTPAAAVAKPNSNAESPSADAGAKNFVSADKRKATNNITSADALSKALEAAASFTTADQGVDLFTDWTRQVRLSDRASSQRFSKGGKSYTFKQVLLESSALEIAAQKCLDHPLDATEEISFKELFSLTLTGPAVNGDSGGLLAQLTAQLARAMVDEESEIVGAAKHAVFAAVGALKQGGPAADVLAPKLQALDKEVSETTARLQTLEASGNQAANLTERIRCSAELLRVTENKFDLTSSGSARPTSAIDGSAPNPVEVLQYLETLASLSQGRLADSQSCNLSQKDMKAEKAKALQEQQKSALQSEARHLAQQILAKEAELQELKAKAKQVQAKVQGLSGKGAAQGESARDEAAKVVRAIQRYEEQLQSTRGLESLIAQHRQSVTTWTTQHSTATNAKASSAPNEYLSAIERQLDYKHQQQADLRQRAERVAKMAPPQLPDEEVKMMGMSQQQAQIQQKMKNMMKDITNSSEEVMAIVKKISVSLQARTVSLRAFPAAAQQLQRVQLRLVELESGHKEITSPDYLAPKPASARVKAVPPPGAGVLPMEASVVEASIIEEAIEREKQAAMRDMAKQMEAMQAQMASLQAGLKEKDQEILRLNAPATDLSEQSEVVSTKPQAQPQRNSARNAKRSGRQAAAAPVPSTEASIEEPAAAPAPEVAPSSPAPKAAVAARAAASAALAQTAAPAAEAQPEAESIPAPAPVVPAEPPKPKKTWGVIEQPAAAPVPGTEDMPTLAEAMAAETKGKGRRGGQRKN
ncbi:hypothetical protein CYMTET_55003 [Cymbomonas tetramitiformis]|uniref:Uncharacterized protein n=1 Tax=Cymbomonas tetramitiformis TaxID=36881 RepID=A0AAE0BDT0_9CHLO|nr:hypothetical protein CYMTET_55003 [Cymbomonas tetramitiformis]